MEARLSATHPPRLVPSRAEDLCTGLGQRQTNIPEYRHEYSIGCGAGSATIPKSGGFKAKWDRTADFGVGTEADGHQTDRRVHCRRLSRFQNATEASFDG